MVYEVKKDGRTYMATKDEGATYPAHIERQMQKAGYDIYVDGKKKRRVK